eukprot:CAMPEP_0113308372 /NCGR_PEP_ID=MMETSP0010_2-20120614/6832_1 /TAXON_ID=216773 ORGANISM="Corethron hystrix, Strain 308" /NCGR_SAMPLE_ID=MMETSP0010_2 /ASSEMBLY_ACC=CAM_ASM_000155 /LENGTH=613 /DNA_ID=CAMNT_0000163391 /DNA_START=216 /DNA_END=2057 /DNA_ORIENTATION=+ /assembly_acc=CAM_ASM_000155
MSQRKISLDVAFIIGAALSLGISEVHSLSIPFVKTAHRNVQTRTSWRHDRQHLQMLGGSQFYDARNGKMTGRTSSTSLKMTNTDDGSLQALFSSLCDRDGLMSKDALMNMEDMQDMMSEGDLLVEEFDDMWRRAPKFPDPSGNKNGSAQERIDVDSFIQVYRDIDDLFEDEDEDEDIIEAEETKLKASAEAAAPVKEHTSTDADDDDDDPNIAMDEEAMEEKFKELCDASGLLSKDALRKWEEIETLIEEGMLGDDEFKQLWESTNKRPGTNLLDVDGFLSFNVALDDLFVFEEIEAEEVDPKNAKMSTDTDADTRTVLTEYDLPPGVIFAAIANKNLLVGLEDLKYWGEVQEVLGSGDLGEDEVKDMFSKIPKAPGFPDQIDEIGFSLLYDAINDLFEEEEDEDERMNVDIKRKDDLLSMVRKIDEQSEIPCGLDCSEAAQNKVLSLVEEIEKSQSNVVINGNVDNAFLVGVWDLVYTSSGMMRFNQGLTGLGGSVPNGKFAGLKQKLSSTKYMADVEYIESISAVPDTSSFEATVTGDWTLKKSVSLLTGNPSLIMAIEPDLVKYGPTSTRADHWKSVRSMNLLDITYLDDDTRVMRGNTSTDTIFIFRRT